MKHTKLLIILLILSLCISAFVGCDDKDSGGRSPHGNKTETDQMTNAPEESETEKATDKNDPTETKASTELSDSETSAVNTEKNTETEEKETNVTENNTSAEDVTENKTEDDTSADTKAEDDTDAKDTASEETETELERFDYFGEDMSDYISVDKSLYSGVKINVSEDYIITDKHVDEYINSILYEYRTAEDDTLQVTDQAIRFGDSAFIYYKGFLDGVAFDGGSNWDDSTPYELGIGSGQFIPGFEEGLIGVIPANTSREEPFELHVTFPEDYGNELAGEDVIFEVYVAYTVQYELPECDASFITEELEFVAESDDVVAEYKQYVFDLLQEEADYNTENDALNFIWSSLLENARVKAYPENEVTYYYNLYIEEYEYYMEMYKYYGYSFESLDEFVPLYLGLEEGQDWKAETLAMAKTDVSQYLIFHAIAQNEGIEITDEDFDAAVQYYIDYYESYGYTYTAEEIIEEVGETLIREEALFENVNDYLYASCSLIYGESAAE